MSKLFILVTVIYWFSMYVYMPILTPYVEGLGASLSMVGLIVGSYGFTQTILRIPLGIFSDRVGKRKSIVIAGVASALISCIGLGLANTPIFALLARGLAGVAAAAWVVFTVLYASYFSPENTAKAMSTLMFYNSFGQLLATTLGGFVADRFGYQAPFILGGIVGMVGFAVSLKIKETTVDKEPLELRELVKVGRQPQLLKISLLAILVQAITFSTIYGFNQTYAASIGGSDKQLTLLMFVSALAIALASLTSGRFAEKLGEQTLALISFLMMAITTICIPFTNSFLILSLTQVINGFGRGLIFPVLMGLSIGTVSDDKRSTAMGFFQAIYGLGMTFGPVLVGSIGDLFSLKAGYLAAGSFAIIGFFLVLSWSQSKIMTKQQLRG